MNKFYLVFNIKPQKKRAAGLASVIIPVTAPINQKQVVEMYGKNDLNVAWLVYTITIGNRSLIEILRIS